ncbi:hypothetical protein [Streptomyces sp. NPDC002205]|uniref:hypothetical protein n=1 Tax=Streptomyces sp. NPDC002205 TaxID=3154411 RepID=UPI003330A2B4
MSMVVLLLVGRFCCDPAAAGRARAEAAVGNAGDDLDPLMSGASVREKFRDTGNRMQELNRLTTLRRRIVQYEQGVRDAVTDPTAVTAAEELLARAPQLDLEATAVLAWFYWYLRLEVTEHAHEEATDAAVRLFFRVRDLDPDAVLPPVMEQQYAARAAARELDTALAAALARDASHGRDPDAMYWAIAVLTEAEVLAIEAGAHADRVVYRCLRGHQLCALYEVLGRAQDLDRAVADLSNALRHAPDDPATAAVMHGYLGRAFLRRHQLQGRPEDLEAALAELRRAHRGLAPLGPDDRRGGRKTPPAAVTQPMGTTPSTRIRTVQWVRASHRATSTRTVSQWVPSRPMRSP